MLVAALIEPTQRPAVVKPVPDDIHELALSYQAAIPAPGAVMPSQAPEVDSDEFGFNRGDRLRVFLHLAAQLEREAPLANGDVQIERLSNLMMAVENVATMKGKYDAPKVATGNRFEVDPKYMLVRSKALVFGDRVSTYFTVNNGQLTPAWRKALKTASQLRVMPSTCEYTLVNGEGAVMIVRVRETPGRERFYPYYNSPQPEDLEQGNVILNIPINGKDALGRPSDKGITIDPAWQMTDAQKKATGSKKGWVA